VPQALPEDEPAKDVPKAAEATPAAASDVLPH